MLDRYFITLGARTTAGGKVVSSSRFETINGIPVAVEGDTCWCPACLAEGVIRPDGPRLPESIDGREVALHDDLCICKCSPPPRLVAAQSLLCQSVDGDWYAGQVAAAAEQAARANTAGLSADVADSLPLVLVDVGTQEPLADRPYRLELPTRVVEGMLDHEGRTEALSAAERDAVLTGQAATIID
jgi:uncharacterized Zn-binding protein involved in type VI secretion